MTKTATSAPSPDLLAIFLSSASPSLPPTSPPLPPPPTLLPPLLPPKNHPSSKFLQLLPLLLPPPPAPETPSFSPYGEFVDKWSSSIRVGLGLETNWDQEEDTDMDIGEVEKDRKREVEDLKKLDCIAAGRDRATTFLEGWKDRSNPPMLLYRMELTKTVCEQEMEEDKNEDKQEVYIAAQEGGVANLVEDFPFWRHFPVCTALSSPLTALHTLFTHFPSLGCRFNPNQRLLKLSHQPLKTALGGAWTSTPSNVSTSLLCLN
jgi:hypothetical protein